MQRQNAQETKVQIKESEKSLGQIGRGRRIAWRETQMHKGHLFDLIDEDTGKIIWKIGVGGGKLPAMEMGKKHITCGLGKPPASRSLFLHHDFPFPLCVYADDLCIIICASAYVHRKALFPSVSVAILFPSFEIIWNLLASFGAPLADSTFADPTFADRTFVDANWANKSV
jgi:hypothetical protein